MEEVKTYTEDEFQQMSAGRYSAGIAAVLKEAGLDASENGEADAHLQAFREWYNGQKGELETAGGNLTAEKEGKTAAEARVQLLERKLAVIESGIPADATDKYIKLAGAYLGDGVDFSVALEQALKDFPIAVPGVPGSGGNPPPYAAGKSETNANQTMNNLIRKKR